MARPAGFEPATLGLEGRVKSHRITVDLGKTGSAVLLSGRSHRWRLNSRPVAAWDAGLRRLNARALDAAPPREP